MLALVAFVSWGYLLQVRGAYDLVHAPLGGRGYASPTP